MESNRSPQHSNSRLYIQSDHDLDDALVAAAFPELCAEAPDGSREAPILLRVTSEQVANGVKATVALPDGHEIAIPLHPSMGAGDWIHLPAKSRVERTDLFLRIVVVPEEP